MSRILRHMTAISRCGAEYRKQYLCSLDLEGRHARCILEVCDRPGISQEGLSRRLLLDKSTVARQCVSLEEAGFLVRKPCPEDKRILQLFPTEKALTALPQIAEAWNSWEDLLTQEFTDEEKTLLSGVLLKMKSRARQWMEEH